MGRIWGLLFASSKEPAYAVLEFRPKWMIFRPLTRRTFSPLLRHITLLSFYPFLLSLFLSSFFSLSPFSHFFSLPHPLPTLFHNFLYSSSAFSPSVLLIFLLTFSTSSTPTFYLFLSSSFSLFRLSLLLLFLSLFYFTFSFSLSLVFRR
jgi:hypothetical protein